MAPTWDVQLSVPLLDTIRTVNEMIEKDLSVIQIDPTTDSISYSDTKSVGSDSVGDRIKITPRSSRLGVRMGPLSVANVQVGGSVTPVPPGMYPVFPATTVRVPALSFSIPDFSNLTLDSGFAQLVITNNLPVDLTLPEPITLTDGMGRTVATFSGISGAIPPGGSATSTDNLANRSMDNSITISSTPPRDSITISLSGGTNVTFDSQSRVSFTISFRNMIMSSATARIPTQTLFSQDSATFVIDDSTFIQSAFFKSGSFTINMSNQVDLIVRARLRLPQLRNRFNNDVFDSSVIIGPIGILPVSIDLSRYKIDSPTPTKFLFYTVHLYQVDSSGIRQATVRASDSLIASIVISPGTQFIVQSASIVVKPIQLDIDTSFGLRLGDLLTGFSVDSLRLPDANFILRLTTPVAARLSNLRIIIRSENIIDTIRYMMDTPVPLQDGILNSVVFNDVNSTIVQALNRFIGMAKVLPDSLRVLGNCLLNPDYDTLMARTIADTSKISGDFLIDLPLNIGIKNGTFRDTVNIADKFRVDQEDINHLNRATLSILVQNRLPASLQLVFIMLDANKDSSWVFPRTGGPILVNAASVGSDGFSNQSVQSLVSLTIGQDDVRALVNAKFLDASVTLNTSTSASSVKFRATDSIKIRVFGTISYRVSPGG